MVLSAAEEHRMTALRKKGNSGQGLTKPEKEEYRKLREKREKPETAAAAVSPPRAASPKQDRDRGRAKVTSPPRGGSPKQSRGAKIQETTEEQIEPENRWWEKYDDALDGGNQEIQKKREGIMWNTMEHHGIMFPPPYAPHNKPLIYQNHKIHLPPAVEELATYWCSQIGLESETKEVFINNFWQEFRKMINESKDQNLIQKVKDFRHCNWSEIHQHLIDIRERRKGMSKEAKDAQKIEKEKMEASYRYCLINGYREKVGSIQVEPPGLFKGRGEHPQQGKLKDRITPQSMTMNCDNGRPPPICAVPGWSWNSIVHDDTVNWLGFYKQETNEKENTKYIQLDKTSQSKGEPDLLKYERARRLCNLVKDIRMDYQMKLAKGENKFKKQMGTCAYFIDRLALRVGGEKNTDEEADTVGCCSLRVEHIKLNEKSWELGKPRIILDFLGKDSIRYLNDVPVPPSVFKNLATFGQNKSDGAQMFDLISPSDINSYLQEFMPDLTAKVFRTYNASFTLDQQLKLYDPAKHGTTQEDLTTFYNEANKKVAILCNHQKAVSKGHNDQVEKLKEKGIELKNKFTALEKHVAELRSGSAELIQGMPKTLESGEKQLLAMTDRLRKHMTDMTQKETNKNVSLTTSKINYMDPRITIAFCKKTGLEITKVFSKSIQQKFPWALSVRSDYCFVKKPTTTTSNPPKRQPLPVDEQPIAKKVKA